MVRRSKRFNQKGRQSAVQRTEEEVKEMKLISDKIDIKIDERKYDFSNPLVLVKNTSNSKTNKTKVLNKIVIKPKVLSKKQRKKLEKVLDRRNRKLNRAKLLNDLQEFKAEDKELALMSSTSDVQTCGRKRFDLKMDFLNEEKEIEDKNAIKYITYKKIKRLKVETKKPEKDLNIIGVSDDSDNDSQTDESEEEDADEEVVEESNEQNINDLKTNETIISEKTKNENKMDEKVIETSDEKCDQNETKVENIEKLKRNFVQIYRSAEIEKTRSTLPVVSEEHTIMDAIFNNPVVIICGETGSGKTTQVPQFLFEAGFTLNGQLIGVTEPRRVAAIAMSKRVGQEMNVSDKEVSFQIRFESNVTQETKVKFMTDGVLLKEIQNDFLLNKYSVIVIDEAHERSLYSDILIGLLSRIVPLRTKKQNPLKLIIMSATLRVEDFTTNNRLFKTIPPVLKIDCRQFPVSVHFNKKTNSDYIHEAFNKVCKIHNECPAGGVLVFVTGRAEVEALCRRLRSKYPNNNSKNINENKNTIKTKRNKKKSNESPKHKSLSAERIPTINLDDYEANPLETERTLDDFDYSDDENEDQLLEPSDSDGDDPSFYSQTQPLHCLPLYSLLPNSQQSLIFKDPPNGTRLCVIATNVAETSLTIPNIKYVVDTGKIKTKVYDNVTGISTFIIRWTSKASADQRAGRAGRTGPGHCYRLYSSAIFNDEFSQYSEPEILRKPTDDLVLQMKSMNIDNVVNFPFPSQPSTDALFASEMRLISMRALKTDTNKVKHNVREMKAKITALGKAMSHFPISPRYAKMLALSRQHQLMPYTVTIVSALTIQEIFINNEKVNKNTAICRTTESGKLLGDIMVLLNATGAAQFAGLTECFCKQNGLRFKAMIEINKLRKQLISQINQICSDLSEEDMTSALDMKPPNDLQIKLLRQILLSGFFDRIARKVPILDIDLKDKEKRKLRNSYQSIEVQKPVFISNNSILREELPEYVVYQEMFETTKLQMRNVVAIEPEWLPIFVPDLCKFSNPLETPAPRYDSASDSVKCFRSATFGPCDWPIRPTELLYPEGLDYYKYFAKFLLEGQVIPLFETFSSYLLSSPTIIIKSWASLQPRTERFLKGLVSENINTKKSLYIKWKSHPNYLLKEYMDWLPKSCHQQLKGCWPPVSQTD